MRIDSEERTMKTTLKNVSLARRAVPATAFGYDTASWSDVFDAAWEINANKDPNTHGIPFATWRMMSHVARYAPTMTLRRAAKGW